MCGCECLYTITVAIKVIKYMTFMVHNCRSLPKSFWICPLFNTRYCTVFIISSQCNVFVMCPPFSTTAWRHCWAARTTTAAPRCTTLADWVSMTRWRTCWASRGRSASRASPRTRSPPCTLLLSEFNWSPEGREFPYHWAKQKRIWVDFSLKVAQTLPNLMRKHWLCHGCWHWPVWDS